VGLDTENLGKINGLLESKKVLRARLNLPEAQPLQGVVTKKPILIGAALPQNSNRGMTESTTQKLGKMTETITKNKSNKMLEEYPEFFPDQGSLTTATTTDLLWLAIQTNVLGISSYSAVRLNRVIPPDFFYDAKYINSILLDELIRISTDWTTRDYDTYE